MNVKAYGEISTRLQAFMKECENEAAESEKNYEEAFHDGMTLGCIVWALLDECKMDGKALQRILKSASVPDISFMDTFLFSGIADDDAQWVAIKAEIAKIKKDSEQP